MLAKPAFVKHFFAVHQHTLEPNQIDRMFFDRFERTLSGNAAIAAAVEAGQWDRVIDYVNREIFDKPEEYYNLDKLRKAAAVDRRITLREILEKVFGLIPHFKSKDELLEDEFAKFVADAKPDDQALFQGLHYQRAGAGHHRQPQFHRPGHQPRFFDQGFQGRAGEVPPALT